MKRRDFMALLGGTAMPLAAQAQQRPTQRRIAISARRSRRRSLPKRAGGSAWRAFFSELRRLGYVEGENLIIERYSADGHHERYGDLARELWSATRM